MMAGANPQKTDDDIRNDVLRKAREHDLPINEKQVTVQRITYAWPDGGLRCRRLHRADQPARLFL